MEIKIDLINKKYQNSVINALNLSLNLLDGNITKALNYVYYPRITKINSKEIKNLIRQLKKDLIATEGHIKIEEVKILLKKVEDNINLIVDERECRILCSILDAYIRGNIGQFDTMMEDIFGFINAYQHDLPKKGLVLQHIIYGGHFHLGIYSPTLNKDIPYSYNLFKVLMYELGVGGVYAYDVSSINEDKLPICSFPKEEYVFKGDLNELFDFLKNSGDRIKQYVVDNKNKYYIQQCNSNISYELKIGSIIVKKYNNTLYLKNPGEGLDYTVY